MSVEEHEPLPLVDTSWLTTENIGDGPLGLAFIIFIIGVAAFMLAFLPLMAWLLR